MSERYFLSALGMINALGRNTNQIAANLFAGDTSGMLLEDGWLQSGPARVGRARDEVPEHTGPYASRTTQLLLAAVAQIENELQAVLQQYDATRIGVVLGTSTSGIAEGEAALAAYQQSGLIPAHYRYTQQEIGITAPFLAQHLGLKGPAYTILTACTSSAKAFASARNLLRHGLCDAVLVGGADSLCRLTVNGFTVLESASTELCNPLSANRAGINIGEGAAVFLMTQEPGPIELLGIGESSDAYHISAPQPEGLGAEAAMRAALADADLNANQVSYLNLHATATLKNDEMESRAVSRVFPDGVLVSGTKPLTGHTLGAAGATELAFCWLALKHNQLPPHIWDGAIDPDLPALSLVQAGQGFPKQQRRVCMSNSFAFGGNNASLVIGDAEPRQ